ncbi:nuclear factor I B [Phyllostomus discolor]|uniref:Nuclear factor I B n=1 Tax=Phyllostomus discolor TaxID=89673 RepID=A0A834B9H6_9CHIR|nr:nuclear factor I B [Phyllostomus discolor]
MCRCETLDVDNSHSVKEKSLVPSGPPRGVEGGDHGQKPVRPRGEKVEEKNPDGGRQAFHHQPPPNPTRIEPSRTA